MLPSKATVKAVLLLAMLATWLTQAVWALDPLDVSTDLDVGASAGGMKVTNIKANGPFHEVEFEVETDIITRIAADKNLRFKRRVDQAYSPTGPWHPACWTSEIFQHPVTKGVTDNSYIYDAKQTTLLFRALPYPSGWKDIPRNYALPYVPDQPMYFRAVIIAASGAESYSETVGPDEPAIYLEPKAGADGAIHFEAQDAFAMVPITGFIGSANRVFRSSDVPISYTWDGKQYLSWARPSAAGWQAGHFELRMPMTYGAHELRVQSIVSGKGVSVSAKVIVERPKGKEPQPARPPHLAAQIQAMLNYLPDAAAVAKGAKASRWAFTQTLSGLMLGRFLDAHPDVAMEIWEIASKHYQARMGEPLFSAGDVGSSAIGQVQKLAYPTSSDDKQIGANDAMDLALYLGVTYWQQGQMAGAIAALKLRTEIQRHGRETKVKEFFESDFYRNTPVYRESIRLLAQAMAAAGNRQQASDTWDRFAQEWKAYSRWVNKNITEESLDRSLAESWPSWHLRQPIDRLAQQAMDEVKANPQLAPMPVEKFDYARLGPGITLLDIDYSHGAAGRPVNPPSNGSTAPAQKTGDRPTPVAGATHAPQNNPPPPVANLPGVNAPPPLNPAGMPPNVTLPQPPPGDPAQPLQQARAATEQGNIPAAMAAYEQALAANPNDAAVRQERALLGLSTNNLNLALSDFRLLAQQKPQDKEIRRLRTLMEIISGDPQIADTESAALLQQSPNDPQVLLLRGQSLMRSGRAAEAQPLLQQARTADANLIPGVYQQGFQFLQRGVPQVAYVQLSTVVWADPQSAGAYYGMAQAAVQLGWRDLAIQAYERFLQMDPTSSFAAGARQQLQQLRARP